MTISVPRFLKEFSGNCSLDLRMLRTVQFRGYFHQILYFSGLSVHQLLCDKQVKGGGGPVLQPQQVDQPRQPQRLQARLPRGPLHGPL